MRTDTVTHRAMLQAIDKGYHITEGGIVKKGRHKVVPLQKHHTQGYLYFGMWVNINGRNLSRLVPVHQFQAFEKYGAEAFEQAQCVRHLDGDRSNNHADNIALGTHRQNYFDKTEEQRQEYMEKMMKAHRLFTPDDWRQIIKRNDNGETVKQIADSLNKKYHQIGNGIRYWRGKR